MLLAALPETTDGMSQLSPRGTRVEAGEHTRRVPGCARTSSPRLLNSRAEVRPPPPRFLFGAATAMGSFVHKGICGPVAIGCWSCVSSIRRASTATPVGGGVKPVCEKPILPFLRADGFYYVMRRWWID